MKKESHILIKYVVIPITFLSLLVIMDFLGKGVPKQETVISTNAHRVLSIISCKIAYTDHYSFSYCISDQGFINNEKPVTLYVTPIFDKVKSYAPHIESEKYHITCLTLIGHIVIPIITLLTGLLALRSNNSYFIGLLIIEGIMILLYLIL